MIDCSLVGYEFGALMEGVEGHIEEWKIVTMACFSLFMNSS